MGLHFQGFANNPLTESELIFLRRQPEKAWKRARIVLFMTAMAVSVTPLWLYLDANQTGTLLLMVVVIYVAHVVVGDTDDAAGDSFSDAGAAGGDMG